MLDALDRFAVPASSPWSDVPEAARPAPGKVTLTSRLANTRRGAPPEPRDAAPAAEPGVPMAVADDPFGLHEAEAAVAGSTGTPLAGATAERFGALLGIDVRGVQLHTDGPASAAAAAMGATAFTAGDHVAFAPGRFAPDTAPGAFVLAHELVHVAQQRAAGPALAARAEVGPSGSAVEAEADAGATALLAGQRFQVRETSGLPRLSRFDGPPPTSEHAAPPVAARPDEPREAPPPPDGAAASRDPGAPPVASMPPDTAAPPSVAAAVTSDIGAGGTASAAGSSGGAHSGASTPTTAASGSSGGAGGVDGGAIASTPAAPPAITVSSARAADLDAHHSAVVEAAWDQILARVDAFRIGSYSFSYNPTNAGHLVVQQFWPTDTARDQLKLFTSNNPYVSRSKTSVADVAQGSIEVLRGVIRELGNVAGAVANISGAITAGAAAVAAVGAAAAPLAAGAGTVAAIAAQVSTLASMIKLLTSALELQIGALQMLILAVRMRFTTDAAERERLVALMKKEAADFTNGALTFASDLIGVLIGVMTGGMASAVSGYRNAATADVVQTAAAVGRRTFGLRASAGAKAAGAEMRTILATMGGVGDAMPKIKAVGAAVYEWRRVGGGAPLATAVDAATDGLAVGKGAGKAVYAAATPIALGSGVTIVTGQGKASGAAGDNDGKGAAPGTAPGTTEGAMAWPGLLPRLAGAQGDLRAAKDRMNDHYRLAREDLGSEEVATQIDAAAARLRAQRDQRKAMAQSQAAAARHDAAAADRQAVAAAAVERHGQQVAGHQAAAQGAAQGAAAQTGSFGGLSGALGQALLFVQQTALRVVLAVGGATPQELAAAGFPQAAAADKRADTQAAASADQTAQEVDAIEEALRQLQTGRDLPKRYAMMSMADALRWMMSFDELDADLAEAATRIVEQINTVDRGRDLNLAPAMTTCDEIVAFAQAGPPDLERRARDGVANMVAEFGRAQLDASQPAAVAGQFVGQAIAVYRGELAPAAARATALHQSMRGLDASGPNQSAADLLVQEVMALEGKVGEIEEFHRAQLRSGIIRVFHDALPPRAAPPVMAREGQAPGGSTAAPSTPDGAAPVAASSPPAGTATPTAAPDRDRGEPPTVPAAGP